MDLKNFMDRKNAEELLSCHHGPFLVGKQSGMWRAEPKAQRLELIAAESSELRRHSKVAEMDAR